MIELIVLGLVAHMIGDYVLQNDWIAIEKTKRTWVTLIHIILYSIPFFFIVGWSWALLVIAGSHFFIDRFRLAVYWIKLINWNWKSDNFGFNKDKPIWMSVWLMIIYDNIFHIVINTLSILYLM